VEFHLVKQSSVLFACVCRPQYFKVLDQCVSQIVLHKSGIDPDFHYTQKFSLDVDPLVGKVMVSAMKALLGGYSVGVA